jgi:aminoglycoside phosphotransferase family enzyme/predicted kinase
VYLGVAPILRRADGTYAVGAVSQASGSSAAAAIEWSVKMRRLAEHAMLDRMVADGVASVAHIRDIAVKLADFHRAASSEKGWKYGSAATVWRLVHGNLEEVVLDAGGGIAEADVEELRRCARGMIESRWALLNRRALGGHVCEGHGDLRCEHVSITEDAVAIIDCIEFSERLRYGDTASDIGFLAMDLDRLGARAFSDELVGAYREAADDPEFHLLVPPYKFHRALVRAKVEYLTGRDPAIPSERRIQAASQAGRYISLALEIARESRPVIVAVCGLSGTGKSTLARRLADRLGFECVRSDEVRKRLAGVAPTDRLASSYGTDAYASGFTRKTYGALLREAESRTCGGAGVILDATFGLPELRAEASAVAARTGTPLLFVECVAGQDEVIRRLSERARRQDEISDADVEVYLRQRNDFVPLREVPDARRIVINTERGLEAAAAAVTERLRSLGGAAV